MDWTVYCVQGFELLFFGIGSYFDIKDRELPMLFLTFFGMLAVVCNILWKYQSLESVIMGSVIGGSFLVIGWVSKEAVGYGDGIGLLILGIFEGFHGMVPVMAGAFIFSGIYGLWNLLGLKKSGSDTMPFFPFLLLAFIGVMLL